MESSLALRTTIASRRIRSSSLRDEFRELLPADDDSPVLIGEEDSAAFSCFLSRSHVVTPPGRPIMDLSFEILNALGSPLIMQEVESR